MPDQRQQNQQQNKEIAEMAKEKINKCNHLKDMPAEDIVDIADKMGGLLSRSLKINQIRKFFDGIRRIDNQFERGRSFNRDKVILLKPKLAYAAGRQQNVRDLMEVLNPAIDKVNSYECFKKLVALIEGIVAYHKYYGGRD